MEDFDSHIVLFHSDLLAAVSSHKGEDDLLEQFLIGSQKGVATTSKQACETPIHSLRGRLTTLLRIPVTLLS
ncbi:MAG: hypothetical protein BA862_07895 [Desulfobulbaceae bacterium S3730MH12]|nr:MAG: hypothetical protein BA866_01085 [Desulfobulbaceae bacterium S5133MH15]OEU54475.1 MAG: hypothetical protein BA862_07895 [Desulfobulbaceae bacterium S3730MH12]OEU81739.1 MAG: hypothetical protein BA873_05295 [Desulfobulbaceae bacterium C00003063]